ncbi:hypothetical protein L1887_31694 [Cichorium endivia]|nr:hypothetical protein L1887_31694 [Cichorium endivia]
MKRKKIANRRFLLPCIHLPINSDGFWDVIVQMEKNFEWREKERDRDERVGDGDTSKGSRERGSREDVETKHPLGCGVYRTRPPMPDLTTQQITISH